MSGVDYYFTLRIRGPEEVDPETAATIAEGGEPHDSSEGAVLRWLGGEVGHAEDALNAHLPEGWYAKASASRRQTSSPPRLSGSPTDEEILDLAIATAEGLGKSVLDLRQADWPAPGPWGAGLQSVVRRFGWRNLKVMAQARREATS